MASAGHQMNPKKGGGGGNGMYVYKLDTGSNQNQKQPPEKTSRKISWGLRRSKTVREVVNHHHDISGGRNSVGGEYDEKQVVVEPARKSTNSGAAAARRSACSESVAGAGRKSVSYLEVNVAAVAALLQVKILVTDMPGFMQVHAFRCARTTYDSLEKFSPKHMAYNLKKEFDKVYGPAWHCIVGSSFGSFVTHSTGGFLYFSMEKLHILVFKTKVLKTLQQP